MSKKLKGTKTEANLLEAFAGESMARNKYTYFASVAKKAVSSIVQTTKSTVSTVASTVASVSRSIASALKFW